MTATVHDRQSVFDVALQYFGTAEAAFLAADRLGIAVTDTPPRGATFEYQPDEVPEPHIAEYYARSGIVPTTALENQPK